MTLHSAVDQDFCTELYRLFSRNLGAASEDGSGGWLVSGGYAPAITNFVDTTEIYSNGAWREGPKLPSLLYKHCQVIASGKVIITGGQVSSGYASASDQTLALVENKWIPVASMKEQREYHACTEFQGEVFVFGGQNLAVILDSVEIYNPISNSWRFGPNLTIPLMSPQAVTYMNDIYVLAGLASSSIPNKKIFKLSGPKYDNWEQLPIEIDWNSERIFVSPPVVSNELLHC